MLCGEVPAAHDRPNQELSGMEPEGESEFGSRVEGAARTPIFWNLIEVWSWVARTGGSRSYCFWKLLCNLAGDLAWMSVRAGDVLNIGTVGCENVWVQKACISQRLQVGVLCVMDEISPIEIVRGDDGSSSFDGRAWGACFNAGLQAEQPTASRTRVGESLVRP